MPELVLKLGDTVVQTYVFDKETMTIGRSRDNDVVIENLSVSRNHARVRLQEGKYVLHDLNSANGTYVNGVKVTKTEVVDADVVAIGKHKLVFANRAAVVEDQMLVDALGGDRTMFVDRAPQASLVVTDGKQKGAEFPLTKFETSIGKAVGCDVVLGNDWFLAGKQATIYRRGNDGFEIHDLGGFRKTKVNGVTLLEPALLKPGDVIELGSAKVVFNQGDAVGSASGRIPQEMAIEDSIYGGGPVAPPPSSPPARRPGTGALTEFDDEQAAQREPEPSGREGDPGTDGTGALDEGTGSLGVISTTGDEEAAPLSGAEGDPMASRPRDDSSSSEFSDVRFAEKPSAPQVALDGTSSGKRRRKGHGAADAARPPAPVATPPDGGSPSTSRRDGPETAGSGFDPATSVSSPSLEALPDHSDPKVAKEIALWEKAMENRSEVVRRQAAKMLKKLTGRDHDIGGR